MWSWKPRPTRMIETYLQMVPEPLHVIAGLHFYLLPESFSQGKK